MLSHLIGPHCIMSIALVQNYYFSLPLFLWALVFIWRSPVVMPLIMEQRMIALNKKAKFYHDLNNNKQYENTDALAIDRRTGTNISLSLGYNKKKKKI